MQHCFMQLPKFIFLKLISNLKLRDIMALSKCDRYIDTFMLRNIKLITGYAIRLNHAYTALNTYKHALDYADYADNTLDQLMRGVMNITYASGYMKLLNITKQLELFIYMYDCRRLNAPIERLIINQCFFDNVRPMQTLVELTITNCKLNEIPISIYCMKNLKHLNLSNNFIKSLEWLSKLKPDLDFLIADFNLIKRLPKHQKWSYIQLMNNRIQHISINSACLYINVYGNPINTCDNPGNTYIHVDETCWLKFKDNLKFKLYDKK